MANWITIDGNYAASYIAYAMSEVAGIYPISPASPMGENVDEWASRGETNIFGQPVRVIQMQSEAGVSGLLHGALCSGALATTFTASQGLLLMIPEMHKIAGEMWPCVIHVASRAVAAHSLSIFGDHSDVMSIRSTGFAILASSGVQEAMDLALAAHLATLRAEVPFLHFFDGYRTSHEMMKINPILYQDIQNLFREKYREPLERFRNRAMRPEKPNIRIASQTPDIFFQARERINPYYQAVPALVEQSLEEIAQLTGRRYQLFEYTGHPEAEYVIVSMGSSGHTAAQTALRLQAQGERVGALQVRLYRPFSTEAFCRVLPESCRRIAVLDRCKEAGSPGEPLYLDVLSALSQQNRSGIQVVGGRFGLSSKEFTPAQVQAVFRHLAQDDPKARYHGFTVGIDDDVSHLSIPVTAPFDITPPSTTSCIFWGLGSDGTVGANKNSVKIIGEHTDLHAQAYFIYDSRKAFGLTVSHLRFGPEPIQMPYEISQADFVASHHPSYPQRYEMLKPLKPNGIFLLNTPLSPEKAFQQLKPADRQLIRERRISFYILDASATALELGIKGRINTIMQAAFFQLAGILPSEKAIELIKQSIEETYGNKGQNIVEQNWKAVDLALEHLQAVEIPAEDRDLSDRAAFLTDAIGPSRNLFAQNVVKPVLSFQGNQLPVSAMSFDGTMPQGTAQLEKRRMAIEVPRWVPENCIQCNLCVITCPHSVIRAKQIPPEKLDSKPETFETIRSNTVNGRELEFRIQIYTDDCTGCGVCIDVCPAKSKALEYSPQETEIEHGSIENYQFFDALPDNILDGTKPHTPKGVGFTKPYFEFHSACAGCGETPYYNLVTKLYGPRMIVANATGCSSIYGGAFPTTPFTRDKKGRGVAWGNSLFEDNAEYSLGMRLAVDEKRKTLLHLAENLIPKLSRHPEGGPLETPLQEALNCFEDTSEEAFDRQKLIGKLAAELAPKIPALQTELEQLRSLADYFVEKSIWAIGGDGWAYDIGFSGLDHVLSLQHNVNFLVLDTQAYSNTGGHLSKATPLGATAKFAQSGKQNAQKDLGIMMLHYGHIYVASVSMGANRAQVIKAFIEAEAHPGPSLIIAYSPCIAHGIDMMRMQNQEKLAVESGYFPLYRYNPQNPRGERFLWDSRQPKRKISEFLQNERRYANLMQKQPQLAQELFERAEEASRHRNEILSEMAKIL